MNAVRFTSTGNPSDIAAGIRSTLAAPLVTLAAAKAVQSQRRAHLIDYGVAHPNKLGAPSTGYYRKAADNTVVTSSGNTASVTTTAVGITHRIYGGLISAKSSRYLAIPVDAQARGRSPRDMNLIPVVRHVGGRPRVVALQDASGRRMFTLKERVRQVGDREVMPSEQQVQAAIDIAVGKAITP